MRATPQSSADGGGRPKSRGRSTIKEPVLFVSGSGNITVCVRVRPFNRHELSSNEGRCVDVRSSAEVVLSDLLGTEKSFIFDRVFDSSIDPSSEDFATQDTLMADLGIELKQNALEGYNSCLFAYGQTGSGKTYSVLGAPDSPGLLPRVTAEVFDALNADQDSGVSTYSCSVAYLEIYMESLRDLLAPPGDTTKLDVRHNPQVGVYIQNLRETPVFTKQAVFELLEFGAKNRMVASTCMNDQSSRSHCIFTLEIRRKIPNPNGGLGQVLRSKLNLVDLAGSERQKKTLAAGGRLKEGATINQSLSHLATVISKLAEASEKKGKAAGDFVPFRNSKLTMALMDSLGGNSKTVMIAALSPAEVNYPETLCTLQFAKRVKVVKTSAKQNAETEGSLIERLKAECEQLKAQIARGQVDQAQEQELAGVQALVEKYGRDLEGQLAIAAQLQERRQAALRDLGLTSVAIGESMGLDESTPQLVNVSHDPSLVGCLVYFLTKGDPISVGSTKGCKIQLNGLGMKPTMAAIQNRDNLNLSIEAIEGRVLVNGKLVRGDLPLMHCDRLILGHAYCFRVTIPLRKQDEARQQAQAHDLEVALAEVVPENSDAYQKCKFYVRELQDRIGGKKAQNFLEAFEKVLTLVDEANAITAEIHPNEGLRFCAEVLTDLFRFHQEEPEVVVRLKRRETGWAWLRTLMRKSRISGARRGSECEMETFETVAVLDVLSFQRRLQMLRAIYADWAAEAKESGARKEHVDADDGDDPFGEVDLEEALHARSASRRRVANWFDILDSTLQGTSPQDQRVSSASHSAGSPHSLRLEDGLMRLTGSPRSPMRRMEEDRHRRTQEAQAEAVAQERQRWALADQAKDSRIAELELKLQEAEARAANLSSELQARPFIAGGSRGDASTAVADAQSTRCRSSIGPERSLHNRQELAEAARLASKLIEGLQNVRRELVEQQ